MTSWRQSFARATSWSRRSYTLGAWLTRWLAERVKPMLRESTHHAYQAIVAKHLTPALGSITLQALRPGHVTQYCLERHGKLSRATLELHRTILTSALKSAMKDGLVAENVASLAEGMPKKKERREDVKSHCWTPEEAAQFLRAATSWYRRHRRCLPWDRSRGRRKGELLGLPWSAVNLDAGTVTHVVAARLGHAAVGTTLETYAHALPSHGKQAARTIGSLLWAAQK